MSLKVGDVGTIIYNQRSRSTEAKVIKVGRKWATLDDGSTWNRPRCELASGALDGGNYQSPGTFYTPEALAHRERMIEASRTIEGRGLSFRLGARWEDQDALALADWLDSYFGAASQPMKGDE